MVIKMEFGNSDETVEKTRTYRKVIENVNLQDYVAGFYANRESWRWGRLVEMKGLERKTLRTFGKFENGETVQV